jgi:hypothetical protein
VWWMVEGVAPNRALLRTKLTPQRAPSNCFPKNYNVKELPDLVLPALPSRLLREPLPLSILPQCSILVFLVERNSHDFLAKRAEGSSGTRYGYGTHYHLCRYRDASHVNELRIA